MNKDSKVYIYNTLTRQKEEFIPVEPGKVGIYSCGPTVYNYFHVGNARPFIFFDLVRRWFTYLGYKVTYVQNVTDIDDKIIDKANAEGCQASDIANKYTQAFEQDTLALGITPPDHRTFATAYVGKMIGFIKQLVDSDHAYEAGGDVYFSVQSVPGYGKLSGKNLDDLQIGARVEANKQKRHPADFTLWKAAKPGEPKWNSPWGPGRPGWHTECVVMSTELLGQPFDIHGGGSDLVFPHHENEIAQAKAAGGKPMANYWMHNGFINIEGEKMSKSLGNFLLARDVLKNYDAATVRHFFLSKHYRSPIDYNPQLLDSSKTAVNGWYLALANIDYLSWQNKQTPAMEDAIAEFEQSMNDDFNTAKAIAVLFDLSKKTRNETLELEQRRSAAATLVQLGTVLGFFTDLEERLATGNSELTNSLIELLIGYRHGYKQDKNWAMADNIRDDLAALGVVLKDSHEGTSWIVQNSNK